MGYSSNNTVTIAGQTVNKDSAAIWTLSANDILDDDIVS